FAFYFVLLDNDEKEDLHRVISVPEERIQILKDNTFLQFGNFHDKMWRNILNEVQPRMVTKDNIVEEVKNLPRDALWLLQTIANALAQPQEPQTEIKE
ncbi:6629_t:CDS:2, partial [Dentiscutata erythropus]